MRATEKSASGKLVANRETLQRIFIQPENETAKTTLIKYMAQILFGLHEFLKDHVGITVEASLEELAARFTDSRIPDHPVRKLADVIQGVVEEIAPHAVNVASPYFIGHMTSAIPFFMVHLQTIVAALNQNVVKLETSKVLSITERQAIARIHRMIYGFDDAFYAANVQAPYSCLGGFVSGGTLANLTALWAARNRLFPPRDGFAGIEADGLPAAMAAHGVGRCVVLVSRLGHYSIRKACGMLGIGHRNVVTLALDAEQRVDLAKFTALLDRLSSEKQTRVLAVVGLAGATETGSVDPLDAMADHCAARGIHFHVDAAWGGPVLLSEKYRHLLKGVARADSVTIDGHKQFYMPMGCGMVMFKSPRTMDAIAYHAAYVNRPGSVDLGIRSLEGSRPAVSLMLNSALEIMGARGYALLIEHGIETAKAFAREIASRDHFELVTAPVLNILTYRLFPRPFKRAWQASRNPDFRKRLGERLNRINIRVQRLQREAGNSFVSRTTLQDADGADVVVLRAVIMNPMTTLSILREILAEQERLYRNIGILTSEKTP